jgi:ABC-2 type transport system ATP-binding protein
VTVIEVAGLRKAFGPVTALDGLDLSVPRGTVCALLGPNGAGKTTAVRILATLTRPDAGTATVAGYDVTREPGKVRELIGLAGQHAAVDDDLTGRENLFILGLMHHLGRAGARRRATGLLARFGLDGAGDRLVKTWSGGMRRRLDVVASLITSPQVLFLDEPTTGLDPRSRTEVWSAIRALAGEGTTILLTTQYLDEADALADEIVVIDRGTVIAAGTSQELKNRIGGDVLEFAVVERDRRTEAARAVSGLSGAEPLVEDETARVTLRVGAEGSEALVETVRRLDALGIHTEGLGIRRPSLDDVFLALTGHGAEEEKTNGVSARRRARARRGRDRRNT